MANKAQHRQANAHTRPTPSSPATSPSPTPFLELRIGGLHVTVQRLPYGVIAFLTTVGGAISGATWIAGR
ncbi:hypothetical protein ACIQ6Y_32970 [Streptomyces sp. NPDC096205]|uniref:hypothetical protein n=1 Tax=Streptomyces sp. NPDC096205 TaxID=3366081 RepID=UPI00380055E5